MADQVSKLCEESSSNRKNFIFCPKNINEKNKFQMMPISSRPINELKSEERKLPFQRKDVSERYEKSIHFFFVYIQECSHNRNTYLYVRIKSTSKNY